MGLQRFARVIQPYARAILLYPQKTKFWGVYRSHRSEAIFYPAFFFSIKFYIKLLYHEAACHACTSNVKDTLRSQNDRTVPFPTCISTMHHRISKRLGTNVHHDEGGLYLKGQNENCLNELPC